MDTTGQRQIGRDSLFVMAEMRVDGVEGESRARVRNLSAGGLMAETETRMQRGQLVWIKLRNIGWVEGSIAWVQENRCGIAFREEIDPLQARAPASAGGELPPTMLRRPLYATIGAPEPRGTVRKL